MNVKFLLSGLRRRTLSLVIVLAIAIALFPTAAFASSGYGHQGRAWDPGPRQQRGQHQPAQQPSQHPSQNNNHPSQCAETYRVRPGDTLSGIAARFGVPVNQLAKANGIRNPNRIYAGQVLCIPC